MGILRGIQVLLYLAEAYALYVYGTLAGTAKAFPLPRPYYWATSGLFGLCALMLLMRNRQGRWVSMVTAVARLAHAPGSLYLAAVGAHGIFQFWSLKTERVRSAEGKPAPALPWDGAIAVLSLVLSIATMSQFRVFATYLGYSRQDLSVPIWELVALQMFAIAVHEAGHLAGVWACRFRLRGIKVGPLMWRRGLDGESDFHFSLAGLIGGGHVEAVPRTVRNLRTNWLVICASGPAASFLMGLVGMALLLSAQGTALEAGVKYWLVFASWGFVDGLVNLLPIANSDGAQIWHVGRMTEHGRRILEQVGFLGDHENAEEELGVCDYAAKYALVEGREGVVFVELKGLYLLDNDRAVEAAEAMGKVSEAASTANLTALRARAEFALGNAEEADLLWERACGMLKGRKLTWPEALSLASTAAHLERPQEVAEFVAAARSVSTPALVGAVLDYLEGRAAQCSGDYRCARERSREAIEQLAGETSVKAEERASAALYLMAAGGLRDGHETMCGSIALFEKLGQKSSADWLRLRAAESCLAAGWAEEAHSHLEAISTPAFYPLALLMARAETRLRNMDAPGALVLLAEAEPMLTLATPRRQAHWRALGALAHFTLGNATQSLALAEPQPMAPESLFVLAMLAESRAEATECVRVLDAALKVEAYRHAGAISQLHSVATRLHRSRWSILATPLLATAERLWDEIETDFERPDWAPAASQFEESLCQLAARLAQESAETVAH